MKIIKWFFVGLLTCFILLSAGYWVKNQMGVDVFQNFHLSSYFPFNYLLPDDVIVTAEPGFVGSQNFDEIDPFGNWKGIWSEEPEVAQRKKDNRGYKNSACLQVTCKRDVMWAVDSGAYIKVKPLDTFHYEAKVKIGSVSNQVGISIIGFDEQRLNPNYSFIEKEADIKTIGSWQTIAVDFKIPSGVHYIMPRIWGITQGMARFDDIMLKYGS